MSEYELIVDTKDEECAKKAAAEILAALDHPVIREEKAGHHYHVHFACGQKRSDLTFAFEAQAKKTALETGFAIRLQEKY